MASKGPAPVPQPLRRLRAMPEPLPPPVVPARVPVEPPPELSAAARTVWDRLAPDLVAKGVLDAWNRDAFARLCWLQATSESLRAAIDAEGYVVPGARGSEAVKAKHWPLLRQVHAELVQLESRFRLLPADRSRVSVEREPDTAWAERLLS